MNDSRATPIVYQGQQPSSAPFPKVVYGGVVGAFGNNIYGIRRVSYVAQAATTDQVIISPNGTCSNGLATPQSFVLAFGTQQAVDSYGLNILGGPAEPEPGNIFTQAVGTSSTRVVLGFKTTKGKGGRKLPWISGIQQGDGITEDLYGTYDYITPDGVVHTAPGPKDKIVNTPLLRVKLAMSGATDISYLKFTGDPDPIYQNKGLAADIDKIKAAIESSGGGDGYKSGFGIEINGVTPPTGVTLELAAGTDLGIGLYDYVFTKRTSTHKESGPSAPFAITTTTGNRDVTITLPALDPTGDPLTIGYSIYRSPVGGTGTPISQCSGVTTSVDGTGKTTYQYQIPASYLLSYDPSVLAVDGAPPLPIDPATGLACTFDSGTGLFMSDLSVFDATVPQTYTSGQGYTFVADHGAGVYTDTASDASIATNKRPPGDNTPEIDTLLATVDETLHSPLKSGLINTGPSGGLKPLGRGLKINPAVVGGVDVSGIVINAGDDANGVQVTGLCPEYLTCTIPIGVSHGLLNIGPGLWDGSSGEFHDFSGGGGLAGEGEMIAMKVPSPADLAAQEGLSAPDALAALARLFYLRIQAPWSGSSIGKDIFSIDGSWLGANPLGAASTTAQNARIFFQGDLQSYGASWQFNRHPDIDTGDVAFLYVEGKVIFDDTGHGEFFDCQIPTTFDALVTFDGGTSFSSALAVPGFTNTGPAVLNASVLTDIPLSIAGASGQSADLIQAAATIGGPPVFSVSPTGAVTALSAHFTGTSTLTNDGRSDHKAIAAPATPASGYTSLYSKTVAGVTKLYFKDDGGTEYDLSATGGGGGVTSLNSLTGALSIAAGTGVTVTPSGSTITIAATGTTGAGELLVADGVTSPPVALYTEDGSDFIYEG